MVYVGKDSENIDAVHAFLDFKQSTILTLVRQELASFVSVEIFLCEQKMNKRFGADSKLLCSLAQIGQEIAIYNGIKVIGLMLHGLFLGRQNCILSF